MIPTPVLSAIATILDRRPDNPDSYIDIGPECFAGVWANGRTVICFKGENYTLMRLSPRTRIRNWVVGVLNRRHVRGITPAQRPDRPTDKYGGKLPGSIL